MARLVTVTTYGELYLAEMARAALEDAGVIAFLADAEVVGNLWHLSTAVGGIKLQVAEEDAERALTILKEVEQHREIDEDELAREAMEAPTEDEWIAAQTAQSSSSNPESPGTRSEREEQATRALWWMVGGLFFTPAWVVGMSYLLSAAVRTGPLSPSGRISPVVAGVLAAITTLLIVLVMTHDWGFN